MPEWIKVIAVALVWCGVGYYIGYAHGIDSVESLWIESQALLDRVEALMAQCTNAVWS